MERVDLVMAAKAEKAKKERLAAIQGDGGRDGRLAVMGDWWKNGWPVRQDSMDIITMTGVCGP